MKRLLATLAAARFGGRRRAVVVLYHRIVPEDPRPDPLVPALGARDFAAQLRLPARRYAVVPLAELPRAIAARCRGGRVPVVITFDEDLVEHMRVAAPRLRAQGLPATLFLCGASLERPHRFWWDGLLARGRGLDPAALLPAELGTAPGEPLEALAAQRNDSDPALRRARRGGARGRALAARRSSGGRGITRAGPASSTAAFTRCAILPATTGRRGARAGARGGPRGVGGADRAPAAGDRLSPRAIDERVGAAARRADRELGAPRSREAPRATRSPWDGWRPAPCRSPASPRGSSGH